MSTNPPDPQGQPTPPPAYSQPAPPPAYAPPGDSGPSGYPAAGYAPPVGEPAPKTKGPSTLGVIAFLAALAGIVIGSILAFVGGMQLGSLAQYAQTGSDGSVSIDGDSLPVEAQQIAVASGVLVFVAFVVWGLLALWGLIQGIFAAVKNRGRVWGIIAIVLAVIGVGAVATFYGIGAIAGAASVS